NAPVPASNRAPFDDAFCAVVEELKPEIVSFHFGLPDAALVARVRAAGAKIIACATTVAEAIWLDERGGHRGNFLSDDLSNQVGTFALTPLVADAVKAPVIAAGGISDARGIVA